MSRRRSLAWLAALILAVAFSPPAFAGPLSKPNIVFVLTDDLSWDLVSYMPQVQAMQRQGTTFDRFIATNSLCCPSRASILSGRYPHSTGVLTNMPPAGGFEVFHMFGEWSTFATSLQASGYMTAMMGKYLNGYRPGWYIVPPGWTSWAVAGEAYNQFGYTLLEKTPRTPPTVVRYGKRPRDYLTDVISRHGQAFIADAVKARRPFLLELSTFSPHAPFTPAPRDALKFPEATVPRGSLFDAPPLEGSPAWLPTSKLSPRRIARLDRDFRRRAQSVQSVDRMIADIRAQLSRLGVANNTYIVFASDNGFHMGERRLTHGKQTAFDHDIRVPLVVVGPGVPAGASISQLAANIDLRPTFQELAGALVGPHVEGRSLVGFLRGRTPAGWRDKLLIEHRHSNNLPGDPDRQGPGQGKPPSYTALRFADALYVEYENPKYAPEYYDLASDPHERSNVFGSLAPASQAQLADQLARLRTCSGGAACQSADQGS